MRKPSKRNPMASALSLAQYKPRKVKPPSPATKFFCLVGAFLLDVWRKPAILCIPKRATGWKAGGEKHPRGDHAPARGEWGTAPIQPRVV